MPAGQYWNRRQRDQLLRSAGGGRSGHLGRDEDWWIGQSIKVTQVVPIQIGSVQGKVRSRRQGTTSGEKAKGEAVKTPAFIAYGEVEKGYWPVCMMMIMTGHCNMHLRRAEGGCWSLLLIVS